MTKRVLLSTCKAVGHVLWLVVWIAGAAIALVVIVLNSALQRLINC